MEVPDGEVSAKVEAIKEPAKPNWLRHNLDFLFLAAGITTIAAFRLFGGRAAVRTTSQRLQQKIKENWAAARRGSAKRGSNSSEDI